MRANRALLLNRLEPFLLASQIRWLSARSLCCLGHPFERLVVRLTNEMDSSYLAGIVMCQSGVSRQPLNDRRSPNEYYNDWYRFGED